MAHTANTTTALLQEFFGKHIVGHCPAVQGRGIHVTGVSAAYTFKLNKNILSE
jgi:hypothetical protein